MTRNLMTALAVCLAISALTPSAAAAQQEVVEYYGLDAIGSVRVVFDQNGAIKSRRDYDPFGGEVTPVTSDPKVFAGLFRDDESEQDYAQARMYSSRTGRFGSVDPVYAGLFDPQQWNRYSYAKNSPASYVDPTGLNAQAIWKCTYTSTNDSSSVHCDEWIVFNWNPGGGGSGGSGGSIGSTSEPTGGLGRGSGTQRPAPGTTSAPGASTGDPAKRGCDAVTGAGCTPSIPGAVVDGFVEGVGDTLKALSPWSDGPQSCLLLFAKETVSNLVPISPSAAAVAEPMAMAAGQWQTTQALQYAASRPT